MSHRIPITLGPNRSYSMADPDHPLVTRAHVRFGGSCFKASGLGLTVSPVITTRRRLPVSLSGRL